MKHFVGMALLVLLACLLRWWIPSGYFLTYPIDSSGNVMRVRAVGRLDVIVFWGLLAVSATWGLVVGLLSAVRHRNPL